MSESTNPGNPKILIIEDEESIWSLVKSHLEREGFQVEVATEGKQGLQLARHHCPDLIVLDLMLPGMDGLEICRIIRAESPVYILILTTRTDEVDRVVGLTMGADDYVTKPFSPRELVARVKAALRREQLDSSRSNNSLAAFPEEEGLPPVRKLEFGRLVIEPEARKAWVNHHPLDLTRTEFDLLLTLAEMPNRVFSREKLLETVWGYDYFGDERVVDVHIGQLRKKLEAAGGGQPVKTVWGVGYRFEPVETQTPSAASPLPPLEKAWNERPSMLMCLRWRLFASYFVIIIVGVVTLFGAASWIANAFFHANIRTILAEKGDSEAGIEALNTAFNNGVQN